MATHIAGRYVLKKGTLILWQRIDHWRHELLLIPDARSAWGYRFPKGLWELLKWKKLNQKIEATMVEFDQNYLYFMPQLSMNVFKVRKRDFKLMKKLDK